MKYLFTRLCVASIAIVATIYGCSGESESPVGPVNNTSVAPVAAAGDCGAAGYLDALSPVVAEWQDSLESAFAEPFDDAPVFLDDAENYLNDLAPVMQQWEMTINTALNSAVVDTVPDFDPANDSTPQYLLGLSDLLQQWKSSLDTWAEMELLPAPPVYEGDVEAPMIICPADTTVGCGDSSGVAVDFDGLIEVSDDCDPSPDVTCEPASGSTFMLGSTLVTCTATDSLGNESTCTFTVTVEAAEPPVIQCPEDITAECMSPEGTVVEFEVTATSECDTAVAVVCDPPSGSTFSLGTSIVTCVATDVFGNTVECSFSVSVQDTTPPTMNGATASPAYLWPPNHKMVEVEISVDVTDICDSTPSCTIIDVTSNEDVNGRGDGNTEPDWNITGELTVELRAERAGPGDGRIYYVTVLCEDDSGNGAERVVEVRVAHDRGRGTASQ